MELILSISMYVFSLFIFVSPIYANEGEAIEIGNLNKVLWDIVATIQFYSIPIVAISIAGIGLTIVFSGDDTAKKENLKEWIVKIVIGGILIFSSATIARIIKNSIGVI